GEGKGGVDGVSPRRGAPLDLLLRRLRVRSRRLSAKLAKRCWAFLPKLAFPESTRADNADKAEIRLPPPLPQLGSSEHYFLWRSEPGKSTGNRLGSSGQQ